MYSHNIIFKLGDGGKFIEAEYGLVDDPKDKTKKIFVYRIISVSEPLPLDFHQDFIDFMKIIETLYRKYEGLPIILSVIKQPTTVTTSVKDFSYVDGVVKIKYNH
jgi:hypothetical protein